MSKLEAALLFRASVQGLARFLRLAAMTTGEERAKALGEANSAACDLAFAKQWMGMK